MPKQQMMMWMRGEDYGFIGLLKEIPDVTPIDILFEDGWRIVQIVSAGPMEQGDPRPVQAYALLEREVPVQGQDSNPEQLAQTNFI
ncbi:MAG: hypothetical protein HZA50_01780 [Planctomycetes bacterium]|nr:hypothetical protein [Planctomycetota bacterium]